MAIQKVSKGNSNLRLIHVIIHVGKTSYKIPLPLSPKSP